MTANSTRTRKAKGRQLQNLVVDTLRARFGLHEDDIRSCSMGAGGEDIQMSTKARILFPYSIECKNVEKLNVWDAYEQAKQNTVDKTHEPLLVFKRSRSDVMVMLRLEHFIKLNHARF